MTAFIRQGRRGAVLRTAVCALALIFPVMAASQPGQEQDNAVLRWNRAALDAIRTTRTTPPIASRALAIMHTCMYDAWTAYDDVAVGTALGAGLRRPRSERTAAAKETAVSFAAYRALVDLFPGQRVLIFDPLMSAMHLDAASSSEDARTPAGVGNAACRAVLEFRHRDGSNQLGDHHSGAYSDYSSFTPANTAEVLKDRNRWQPLLVNGIPQRWLLPQWGLVTPFALTSGAQFRDAILAQGPYLFPSPEYWRQVLAVVDLSAGLGDREKVIAEFWADGASTVTPPGHWNLIAQYVSRRDHHNLDQDVKFFFVLTNALMDAGIAAWDVKRCADFIRPVTIVRMLLSTRPIRAWGGPGLGVRNIYGRDFRSYLPTPPFSSYVSGHSVFSAAGAEIMKRFSGSDAYGESFTAEAGSSLVEPGLTPATPVTLTWPTFTDAADEAGMSRRYGGIHYEEDDLAGRALGRMVANEVWNKAMRYIEGEAR